MADIVTLTAEGRFREAGLTAGIKSAAKAVYELDTSLSALQNTMKNVTLAPAMQKVVANFKSAISQIKDGNPIKMMDAWKQANKELQDITGVQTMKNAWELLENATTPEKIMSSFNALGNEYKRLASEAEASAKKQQAALKEMYGVALQKYDRGQAAAAAEAREAERARVAAAKAAAKENKITAEKLAWDERVKAEAMQNASKETSKAIDESSKAVQKSNGVFKNFMGSLARIAKLRILRGIIRAVTQAFKEGTQNIYQYSAALGSADASHFKSTMDGLASSFLYLKNSIGSVVAPLLASLVPALQTVIGWVSAALNVLAQFFAVLNGQSTYTRAKQTATAWKEVGGAVGGAAAAAKEYKNTIMSFDEIHALNDPSSGGGGGGGGAGSPNFSDMFEEAELATTGIAGAFNRLATAIKPIIGGIWRFTKNTIQTALDGFSIACGLAVAVFSGDMDAIKKALDDLGVFISKHKALKWIVQATADASGWVLHAIDDIKLAVLSAIEWFINLPLVKGALEAIGLDVDDLTSKIENQKREVNKHKDAVSDNIKVYKMWADGVEISTAKASTAIARQAANGIKDFAGITTSVNNARGSVNNYRSAIDNANNQRPTFANVIRGFDNTAGSAWNAYSSAVAFGNTIDRLRLLNGTTVHFSMAGVVHGGGGFSFAEGGFVPRFDGGGINSADLFLANENGSPELVGRIGNRTAVANQDQMVEVLARGLVNALSASQGGQSSNLEVNVMMDREVLAKAVDRGNRSLNRRYNVSLA